MKNIIDSMGYTKISYRFLFVFLFFLEENSEYLQYLFYPEEGSLSVISLE